MAEKFGLKKISIRAARKRKFSFDCSLTFIAFRKLKKKKNGNKYSYLCYSKSEQKKMKIKKEKKNNGKMFLDFWITHGRQMYCKIIETQ